MLATVLITALIAGLVFAILANEIRKRKKGQPSCSCGGNCGLCQGCPSRKDPE